MKKKFKILLFKKEMILKTEKIRGVYGIRRKVTSKKSIANEKITEKQKMASKSRKWHPKAANTCEWQNKLLQKF